MAMFQVVGARRRQLRRVVVVLGSAAAIAAACASGAAERAATPVSAGFGPAIDVSDGAAAYARHCAACHGASGDADTVAARALFPAPRAFRDGVFKLASTGNGVPTEDDLVRTLRRGLPGSSMPGYDWLPDRTLRALALHVIALGGEHAAAPGAPVRVPPEPPRDYATLAAGEQLFRRHCADCHGADGTGRQPDPSWAGARDMVWARDFTAGFLRGSVSFHDLVCRVRAGMPGARMPATELDDRQTAQLVAFVQSLIPDGAEQHHVQWRRRLRAARLPALPATATDPAWDAIEAVRLPTAPLWWRADAVHEVWLRAAHDGARLAVQLQWDDDSRDDRATGRSVLADGAALELTAADDPPAFAMGGGEAVDLWHWQAFRRDDLAGGLDLLDAAVHQDLDATVELPGVTAPQRRGEAIRVRGPDDAARRRGQGIALRVDPTWRDGRWTVVFARDLAPRADDEIGLAPGAEVKLALAVWDGAIDPNPGSKSVTTWHVLELER
ncbi:MAG: c-type cytochrome [Planctomycetota bacterium]